MGLGCITLHHIFNFPSCTIITAAEDISPSFDQSGTLQGPATTSSPQCFTVAVLEDSVPDGGEMFSIQLSSTDGFPISPGGLQLGTDQIDVTIVEPTVPGVDVEGIVYTH